MELYHDLEYYFRSNNWNYRKPEINLFCEKINELNREKKPGLFPFIKLIVEKTVLEETRHSWEKYPWWYFEK